MYSSSELAFGALLLSGCALAHGTVSGIEIDGKFPNQQYQNPPPKVVGWSIPQDQSTGFVEDITSPDVICHIGATPAPITAPVTAGSNVTVFWTNNWPESHHGPMLDYLAACPNNDCANVDKTQLKFFKIDAVGLVDGSKPPGTWGSDQMIANNFSWTTTIPASIAPGQYVLRHETIALHQAQSEGGAQSYPQCVSLDVQGGGTAVPDGVVGTALYKKDDPGLVFNIYTEHAPSDYTPPGPPVFKG
ncbi:hypothetical protein SLS64_001119 [Diaporthe eres]|uniref:lytic cellulose monooxygenase (C4-dehydrogenating) n=1 Tax=Diaporthe eres TaxID=83184 RepID=A0ABR1PAI9_DIAER